MGIVEVTLPRQEPGASLGYKFEPFGLPLHLQTGVWSFMRLNKSNTTWRISCMLTEDYVTHAVKPPRPPGGGSALWQHFVGGEWAGQSKKS